MDPILHKKASVAENKIALVSKALYIYIFTLITKALITHILGSLFFLSLLRFHGPQTLLHKGFPKGQPKTILRDKHLNKILTTIDVCECKYNIMDSTSAQSISVAFYQKYFRYCYLYFTIEKQ